MKPFPRVLIALLLFLAGCPGKPRESRAPVPIERFAAAYADLLASRIPAGSDSLDERSTTDSLLASHHLTRAEFMAGVHFYNQDVSRWKEVTDQIVRLTEAHAQKSRPTKNSP